MLKPKLMSDIGISGCIIIYMTMWILFNLLGMYYFANTLIAGIILSTGLILCLISIFQSDTLVSFARTIGLISLLLVIMLLSRFIILII